MCAQDPRATRLADYTEEHIRSLDWREHIRTRPGMYIGKLGDGSQFDDGIYVLAKEVIDNCVDEFLMGAGRKIEITMSDKSMSIRDYGRGIPHGKLIECVAQINTGAKYDKGAFFRSVGLNGVGTKAVNALSTRFLVESYRDGRVKRAEFERGVLKKEYKPEVSTKSSGTYMEFEPDPAIFKNYKYDPQFIEERLWTYAYLNKGLKLHFNGQVIASDNGLRDLLAKEVGDAARYPIIHVTSDEIEYAITHTDNYGESYFSFVNGQYTPDGGTHQAAFREGVLKAFREFFKKEVDAGDARGGIVAAVLVRIHEPVFESQTKTKLGSTNVAPDGPTVRSFVIDFVRDTLEKYLHKNDDVAKEIGRKIQQNEKERKDLAGIKKLANEREKKANVHNRKLRDCKVHFTDANDAAHEATQLFITEGDSASGSLNKARDVATQAVFSLKGKPLNCYGLSKKVVYQNEELNLLQHALGIEDDLEALRYNHVVIATDADVDGMHIRLLLLTFFLQFFPELVKKGHLYILQTPLFRVRNKKETRYCYSDEERVNAIKALGRKPEITRFKGLGEISPDEFTHFIGRDIRLERVDMPAGTKIKDLLEYYMGRNTPERRDFITENLVMEPVDAIDAVPTDDAVAEATR
ncbi:MAG: type IIA DNA topoisomerase subunit B [Deltaproteobacteria bacterium]|nr:type IIA DNA topoisomerase subunit B [Deltaproteobacteria bacterium]